MDLRCSAIELQAVENLKSLVANALSGERVEVRVIFLHELTRLYKKEIRAWQQDQSPLVKTRNSVALDDLLLGKPRRKKGPLEMEK